LSLAVNLNVNLVENLYQNESLSVNCHGNLVANPNEKMGGIGSPSFGPVNL
jgi:hypothetical protein